MEGEGDWRLQTQLRRATACTTVALIDCLLPDSPCCLLPRAGLDCDVSCPASVDRLVARAQAHLGAIDVVVNNAGYSGSFQVGGWLAEGLCLGW
jgi:NAD(P)-dependent dehydrogenase (short-subunit alcohol dehydrogenase family)